MSKHRPDSQIIRLLRLLRDGQPHRTDEIQIKVYGRNHLGTANIKARIDELRNEGHNIPPAWPDKEIPSLYWYQLGNAPKAEPERLIRHPKTGELIPQSQFALL